MTKAMKMKQLTGGRNIMITGVSTGIGHAAAQALLARGDRVVGTVRSLEHAEELQRVGGDRFHPVVMDLRHPESIEQGFEQIPDAVRDHGLHALINNAGVAKPGPFAHQALAEVRETFEVNFFSIVHLTQKCLPMLGLKESRSSPGMVVNVSSGAGKISIPFLAGYVASKHALEGFSNSLRRELLAWKIRVVVVGPGSVKTPIWHKAGDSSPYRATRFGQTYENFLRVMRDGEKKGMRAEEIADLLVRIVGLENPKTRYQPVAQKFANWTLPRLLPDKMLDGLLFKTLGMSDLG